jgi:flagellar M-ring protein FliF
VPGLASNGANGTVPTYQAGSGAGATTQKTDRDMSYELNKSVQKVVRSPGSIKRLSVSVMLDDDPNNPDAQLQRSVQDAITAAAGIDLSRGDLLAVTPIAFNRGDLRTTEAALAEATQREQVLAYAHLAALVLGPLLLLLVLWLILRGGRRRVRVELTAERTAEAHIGLPPGIERITDQPGADPAAPRRPMRPPAQPITEDPQKVYIYDQIQGLAKTNPAMVAQLIQTWMDEDRRN